MSPVAQPGRRILVIANRTCPCPMLADEVARRASEAPPIATLPTGRSNWIERGLAEKATARFGIPVAHLVSNYDLVEEAARSGPARAAA